MGLTSGPWEIKVRSRPGSSQAGDEIVVLPRLGPCLAREGAGTGMTAFQWICVCYAVACVPFAASRNLSARRSTSVWMIDGYSSET